MEESIQKFSKGVAVQDAIVNIFRTYLQTFHLDVEISDDRFDLLIDKFTERYQVYIIKSFEDLDIQVQQVSQTEYILVGELMLKVAGLLASKLAAELLLLEVTGKLEALDK